MAAIFPGEDELNPASSTALQWQWPQSSEIYGQLLRELITIYFLLGQLLYLPLHSNYSEKTDSSLDVRYSIFQNRRKFYQMVLFVSWYMHRCDYLLINIVVLCLIIVIHWLNSKFDMKPWGKWQSYTPITYPEKIVKYYTYGYGDIFYE